MKLLFDDRALGDLEGIFHWIAQDRPKSAKSVIDRIFANTELLASFPYIGRAGRDEGTREWVVPRLPYIAVCGVPRRAGLGGALEGEARSDRIKSRLPC